MKKLLRGLQYFFAVIAVIYIVLIFVVDKSLAKPMTICAVIFGTISLLLFIKHKNNKRITSSKDNSIANEQVECVLDTSLSNNPTMISTVEYTPNFPQYFNEDTDKPADAYIFDANEKCIRRSDGQPLNDADCAYIVRNGYEQAKRAEQRPNNPKFQRTDAEKELEFQFFNKYGEKSQKICDVFLDLSRQAYQTDNLEEKLVLLQQCMEAYNTAKEWHYSKSKGARLWFQDNWEYCHNSQKERFSWIDGIDAYRDYIIKMRDVIIPWILESAENGFLQTEIYKTFPDEGKTELRDVITNLVDCGKIKKTKKGNTYFICIDRIGNAGGVQNRQE